MQDAPVYVQFYVTARCNLTCAQCNIIYANSDVSEVSIDNIHRMADNFAEMKVAMVLLTGGEPFTRQDLPEIIRAFESRGVHVRMQTNGLATEERIQAAIEAGGRDISISLDSLQPKLQDSINGGFPRSWEDAILAISNFTRHLPKTNSFASLGCVLQRDNLNAVEQVIRFGSEIGWFTSVVPIHITTFDKPMNFRTYDQSKRWQPQDLPVLNALIERIKVMKSEGYLLYDSDQYLDDIVRFASGEPTTWRGGNGGVCDSPNLYFAVLPNGSFAPCCDHRMGRNVSTYGSNFPEIYRNSLFRKEVLAITGSCSGCMYGSYPEMTISMRDLGTKLERIRTFFTDPPERKWPISYDALLNTAEKILRGRSV